MVTEFVSSTSEDEEEKWEDWNHIHLVQTEFRTKQEISSHSLSVPPGAKATAWRAWLRSSTCCWPPLPAFACSNSNLRSSSVSKRSSCSTLVRQHVFLCVQLKPVACETFPEKPRANTVTVSQQKYQLTLFFFFFNVWRYCRCFCCRVNIEQCQSTPTGL